MNLDTNVINSKSSRSYFHYGFIVVVGAFLTQFVLMICLQGLPLNLAQIEKSLGITHAAAGSITGVFGACYAVCAIFWGWIADKFGPRVAMTAASIVAGIAMIVFGTTVDSVTKAIIIYAFVGFGAAGIYSATIPKVVGAWFVPEKRGKAVTCITPGGTLMGTILGMTVPILTVGYGWQMTMSILGVAVLVLALLIFALVRNHPSEKNLTPFGSPPGTPIQAPQKTKSFSLEEFKVVAKKKITWHLGSFFICWQFPYAISSAFLVLSFVKGGLTAADAGFALVIYKVFTLAGQFVWGPLSDKVERKFIIALSCINWAIFGAGYAMFWGDSPKLMYITVAFMGIGVGIVPCIMAAFSDYFDSQYRGTANGVISTSSFIGRFFGPIAAGILADKYGLPAGFVLASVAMVGAAVISLTLPRLRTKSVI